MIAYAQELIRALIGITFSIISSVIPDSTQYSQQLRGQCDKPLNTSLIASHNYVINPSLEADQNNDGTPDDWRQFYLRKEDAINCSTSHTGTCSFYIGGYKGGYARRLEQTIYLAGSIGTKITVSGWSKAQNVTRENKLFTRPGYGVGIDLFDANGEHFPILNAEEHAHFRVGTHDFEKTETKFYAPANFSCMEVGVFFYERGDVWFDDIEVTVEPPKNQ